MDNAKSSAQPMMLQMVVTTLYVRFSSGLRRTWGEHNFIHNWKNDGSNAIQVTSSKHPGKI